MRLYLTSAHSSLYYRAFGVAQAAFGIRAVMFGGGLSSTIVGAAGDIPAILTGHAGYQSVLTGQPSETYFISGLKQVGVSEKPAEWTPFGVDVVSGGLAGLEKLSIFAGRTWGVGAEKIAISASSPSEIAWGYGSLSKKHSLQLYKSDINLTELASLTAHTGDEFALFTLGSRRIVVHGTAQGFRVMKN